MISAASLIVKTHLSIPSVDGESDVTRCDSERCDQTHSTVSHRVEIQQRIGQMRRQQRVDPARGPRKTHVWVED